MYAFVLVGAGGALGAMGRYGAAMLIGRVWSNSFPLGVISVNILGSLLMGVFVGALARFTPVWQGDARLFFAVGLLGGFTTFSAFSLEVVVLAERGEFVQAGFYILISVLASILALIAGLALMRGAPI